MPKYKIVNADQTLEINAARFDIVQDVLCLLNNQDVMIAAFTDWSQITKA